MMLKTQTLLSNKFNNPKKCLELEKTITCEYELEMVQKTQQR